MPRADLQTHSRKRWQISGQVQGVGFRPFVYRLARRLGLTGFVGNDSSGVFIEAQGSVAALRSFAQALRREAPPLAVIECVREAKLPVREGEVAFEIVGSCEEPDIRTDVTVDTAVCPECISEMLRPGDRRFRYGLINCTDCGPRYSIIRQIPYDRPNTTMAGFLMCDRCRREYEDPRDRRFHAQPIACNECGPKVFLTDPDGRMMEGDTIRRSAALLTAGKVLAIKGLGGFHLAVRADDQEAVRRLRRLKHRDHKPFALMCRDLSVVRSLVRISDEATRVLVSPARPIVLARRLGTAAVAEEVAPGNHRLGVMLPYTPIQHLLFSAGAGQWSVLVMTSGNLSDEPLAIENREAVERLGGMCDAMLVHDRPIERCVDDSVVIDMGSQPVLPVRRARGYVPRSLPLPVAASEEGLCVGGELKCTAAGVRKDRATLSQHLGDLTHPLAFEYFRRAIEDLLRLFCLEPRWIAHDLHPMYLSTAYARRLAETQGVRLIGVQHHHAHAAAVLAEYGLSGPALALTCDGTGYGPDGTIWGGELLLVDLRGYRRLARLRPMLLPGGDAAARDTRRCAMSLLYQAYGQGFEKMARAQMVMPQASERSAIAAMLSRGVNCVLSSGAGRLFDGVAAILGLCFRNEYEAQAGLALESAAEEGGQKSSPLYSIMPGEVWEADLSPLVRRVVELADAGEPAGRLAWLFHDQLAEALATMAVRSAERTGIRLVALSGGVFCNQRLTELVSGRLIEAGLQPLRHRLVPPGDGGLSYGQAAIAAATSADRQAGRQVRHVSGSAGAG